MDKLTDEALVEYCLQVNREEGFAEIVRRYQRQIFSLAYRLTNNEEEAKDLAQEIFLHLYRSLDKYDRSRKFFPWMYRVATNVCYTFLRRKPPTAIPIDKVIEFTPLIPHLDSQPEDYCEVKEIQRLVQQAIADLPENYRLPLVLRYLEDLSYRQIAEIMEVPITTVETRLYRGKALLQKRLSVILERGPKRELSRS
ncbi:sigma-70 family RNA polymerase sigma factor [Calderihabitans maritimus]|uniref:RNA polymerase subunit sigma-24 n=1 Tax=Calderihabitans maritimus TaxID=1246530 RepID=A0A1Z5HWV9_9FIRM|nr:sigma-70 family RNA polymerase sigma factor [Calderihabitans maritimus]GAW93770.1 RNA polymerase subunit sigma-24 [Calderihabitans maritimus]